MAIDLNRPPYFDDFDPKNKYYRILFRPGRSVQARELNQIQSMLHEQIERMGKHLFTDGQNIFPGTVESINYTSNNAFIKLPADQNENLKTSEEITQHWLNRRIKNSAGVEAYVVGFRPPDSIGAIGETRLFLEYRKASDDGNTSVFNPGDKVTVIFEPGEPGIPNSSTIPLGDSPKKTGFVSSVQLTDYNIFFYQGNFVFVEYQRLFLGPVSETNPDPDLLINQDSWNNKPTCYVGLQFIETIKTFDGDDGDESLLDNALGSPNYSAPGADRLHIDAKLIQVPLKEENSKSTFPKNFIPLAKVRDGKIENLMPYDKQYSILENTLARRTYDESGDYVVEPFLLHIKEFLRDPDNGIDGVHEMQEFGYVNNPAKAKEVCKLVFNYVDPITQDGVCYSQLDSDGKVWYYPGKSYDGVDASGAIAKPSFKDLCNNFLSIRMEPGKAYVKGFEITKLGRETIDVPKSRTEKFQNNQVVQNNLGNYFVVSDLVGCPDFKSFYTAELHKIRATGSTTKPSTDPKEIVGTVKITKITKAISSTGEESRMYFTDLDIKDGFVYTDAQSIFIDSVGDGTSIAANLIGGEYQVDGSATRFNPDSTPPTEETGGVDLFGVGTKWKNSATDPLKKGDYIRIGDDPRFWRVANNPPTDTRIEIETINGRKIQSKTDADSLQTWKNGDKIYRVIPSINSDSAEVGGLIFPLPTNFVSAIRTSNIDGSKSNTSDILYTIPHLYPDITITTSMGGVAAPLSLPSGAHSFSAISENTYKIVSKTTGKWFKIVNTSSGNPPSGTVYAHITTSLNLKFNTGDTGTYKVVAGIRKTGTTGIERTKTLNKGYFESSPTSAGFGSYKNTSGVDVPTTKPDGRIIGKGYIVVPYESNTFIELPECDILRITRIVISSGKDKNPSSYSDDSTKFPTQAALFKNDGNKRADHMYLFNNGQTEYYYGYGTLQLSPEYNNVANRPAGKVRVEFDYFDHNNPERDYFSVDTYMETSMGLSYDDIPFVKPKFAEAGIALSDCLDFRRKLSDSICGYAPLEPVVCDYFSYNARIDKIVLDSDSTTNSRGAFKLIQGKPALNPVKPDDLNTAMTICELRHDPYGYSTRSCTIKMEDNIRYTMKDIGKLEKRIKNLEYYTSLSLLESETSSLVITDANGSNRFKNGFLVDNFKSPDSSDRSRFDYQCSLDQKAQECIPLAYGDIVALVEDIGISRTSTTQQKEQSRNDKNYQTITLPEGDVIFTLKMTKKVPFLSYPYATRVININPFKVITYRGSVRINPWADEWMENISNITENVIEDDAFKAAQAAAKGMRRYDKTAYMGVEKTSEWSNLTRISSERRYDMHWNAYNVKVVKAGGRFTRNLSREKQELARKTRMFQVPEGYFNAGEWVPYNREHHATTLAEVGKRTRTVTKKFIRMTSETAFVDKGLSNPTLDVISQKLVDIEYMRPREVKFVGAGFRGGASLYAFFDDKPIKVRPEKDGTDGWYQNISVKQSNTNSNTLIIQGASVFPGAPAAGNTPATGIRSGCEILVSTGTGLPERRLEVVQIADDRKSLTFTEKSPDGVLITNVSAALPTESLGFTDTTFSGTLNNTDQMSAPVDLTGVINNQTILGVERAVITLSPQISATSVFVGQEITLKSASDSGILPASTTIYTITLDTADPTKVKSLTLSEKAQSNLGSTKTFTLPSHLLGTITAITGISATAVAEGMIVSSPNIPVGTRIKTVNTSSGTLSSLILTSKISTGVGQSVSNLKISTRNSFNISISKYTFGDTLLCDKTGACKGTFRIPFSQDNKVKCGDAIFRLTSSGENSAGPDLTSGSAKYSARGWVNQVSLRSTQSRIFDFTTSSTSDIFFQDEVEEKEEDIKSWTVDPIAQTFSVDEDGGVTITDVDIFFYTKPGYGQYGSPNPRYTPKSEDDIRLELRETDPDSSIPSPNIVGGRAYGIVRVKAADVVINQPVIPDIQKKTDIKQFIVYGTAGALKEEIDDSNGNKTTRYFWGTGSGNLPDGTTANKSPVLAESQIGTSPIRPEKIYSGVPFDPIDGTKTENSVGNGLDQGMNSFTYDMIPTRFTFPAPIVLEKGKTYSLVLISDSDEYNVWVSQYGNIEPPPSELGPGGELNRTSDYNEWWQGGQNGTALNYVIGSEKLLSDVGKGAVYLGGNFYKSKNNRGWAIDDKLNLKFTLHKAQFVTQPAEITLVNNEVPWSTLHLDAISVLAGSSKLRIPFINHGFLPNVDRVKLLMSPLSNYAETDSRLKGFYLSILNDANGHLVVSADADSFIIDVAPRAADKVAGKYATSTGRIGSSGTMLQANKRFEELSLTAAPILPNLTEIDWTIVTTSSKGVNDPSDIDPNDRYPAIPIQPGVKEFFLNSMRINAPINEPNKGAGSVYADERSVVVKAILRTSSSNVSPCLNTNLLSLGLIGSRLDNPAGIQDSTGKKNVINEEGFDDVSIIPKGVYKTGTKGSFCFTGSGGKTSKTFTQDDLSRIVKCTDLTINLTSTFKAGDFLTDRDTGQVRIIRKVNSTSLEINTPFNPAFPPGFAKYLYQNTSGMQIKTADANLANLLSAMDVGKYATLNIDAAAGENNYAAFTDKLVVSVEHTPDEQTVDVDLGLPCLCKVVIEHQSASEANIFETRALEIIQKDKFVHEIAPSGCSASSRYICKPLLLDNDSTALRISFDGMRDEYSNFELYYRTESSDSATSIYDKNWTKAEFNIDDNGVLVDKTPQHDLEAYHTYEATIEKIQPFKSVQAKIVMTGGNPAEKPRIKNFTLIAFAD